MDLLLRCILAEVLNVLNSGTDLFDMLQRPFLSFPLGVYRRFQ